MRKRMRMDGDGHADRAVYRIRIQDLEMELYNDEYKDAGDNPKTLNPKPKP